MSSRQKLPEVNTQSKLNAMYVFIFSLGPECVGILLALLLTHLLILIILDLNF